MDDPWVPEVGDLMMWRGPSGRREDLYLFCGWNNDVARPRYWLLGCWDHTQDIVSIGQFVWSYWSRVALIRDVLDDG